MPDNVIIDSGVSSSGLIASNIEIDVLEGGTLTDSIAKGGWIVVDYGGIVQRVSATEGGDVFVNGAASELTAENMGMFDIDEGGTLDTGLIKSNGMGAVYAGGTANEVTVQDGGEFLNNGGTVQGAIIQSGGSFTVQFATANAVDTTLLDGATMRIVNAGNATDTTVSGGFLEIDSGTAANTVVSAGSMRVNKSNIVEGVQLLGGKLELQEATANATVVNGGSMLVYSGGSVSDTTMKDGSFDLFSGTATKTVISGGVMRVSAGNTVTDTTLNDGELTISAASADMTVMNGGIMQVVSECTLFGTTVNAGQLTMDKGTITDTTIQGGTANFTGVTISNIEIGNGGTVTMDNDSILGGFVDFTPGANITINGTIAFDTALMTAETAQINGFDVATTGANASYTLTDAAGVKGTYKLASDAAGFNGSIEFADKTLTVGGKVVIVEELAYSVSIVGTDLVLRIGDKPIPKSDIDGNGISEVMFQHTDEGQIGFWMNGTSEWKSTNTPHPTDKAKILGAYDMDANGRADTVLVNDTVLPVGDVDLPVYEIGYYTDSEDIDANLVDISCLGNPALTVWANGVGNLTGNQNANSIIWYASDMFTLGAWTDGTSDWTLLSGSFGGNDWTMVGCGDFNGDGKDSVLMNYNNGQCFYIADIDGTTQSLGDAIWRGWEACAIGDFAGDGRDDIVLFNSDLGTMVMCIDGNVDNYMSIGNLDATDWFVAGCGDYNGDLQDDLLVRQRSTGLLGYYQSADIEQWVELGNIDKSWTVIA